jgi:hypothetical protein
MSPKEYRRCMAMTPEERIDEASRSRSQRSPCGSRRLFERPTVARATPLRPRPYEPSRRGPGSRGNSPDPSLPYRSESRRMMPYAREGHALQRPPCPGISRGRRPSADAL